MAKKKAASVKTPNQRKTTSETDVPTQPSFEEAFESLETVVRQLEDGNLGLDASLGKYEQGIQLLKVCHHTLSKAERKVELLTKLDSDGNAQTRDFDDQDLSLEDKQQQRARRRSGNADWDEDDT